MTQFYILEIQKYANGEFGHIVHFAFDENPDKARLKAESKYHQVLASAAVSELPQHSAIIVASDGFPVMYQSYVHEVETPAPEPEPETNTEEELEPEVQEETTTE